MGVSEILASIDREIALLQQARALLAGTGIATPKKVGRPRKNVDFPALAVTKGAKKTAKTKKRNLTPEGRKRIAEAVKRRWEAQKKATASPAK
jgi:hypothetical protein